jgi:hypothetical protein
MQGQGRFFSCAPYGTCWEPTNGWNGNEAAAADGPDTDTAVMLPGRFGDGLAGNLLQVAQVSGRALADASNGTQLEALDEDLFPCSPLRVQRLITTNLATGTLLVRPSYDWTVCHTGSWIRRGHRYAWVAGTKRHHICPVHWVRYGHVRGFVPIHPRDVAGKLPLNLQHGIFVPRDKQGATLERVAFNPSTPVKLLGSPPKEFEQPYLQPLARAEEPRLEAHLAKDGRGIGKGSGVHPVGTSITFDRKSQSLVLAHQVSQGGKTVTIAEHFGGEGVREGGFGHSGSGGFSHSGGGGFSHAGGGSSGRSGGSGGGGSHGGGSGGSSGGGGHASSGGGSSAGGGGGGHK